MTVALRISQINQRGSDARGEWVSVINTGPLPLPLTGLELTDFTRTQQEVHIYRFPATTTRTPLLLGAGEVAYVFTGPGLNERVTRSDGRYELHLYAGYRAAVWNNDGDVAYLRHLADGTIVSWLTVGTPARHPGGGQG
jgi:Lamin Tail Domain